MLLLPVVTAEPKMQQRTPSTAPASPGSPTPSGMKNATAASTLAQEAELGTDSVCLSKEDTTQALIRAAESGDLERLCVHDKAVLHGARDEHGMTPLLAAVRQGTANTVFHLVTRLGDDCVFANQRTVSGMTCLHLAAERRATVAEADSSADMLNFLFESFWGKEGFPAVDTRDKQGCSALHVACTYGDAEAAKCLLKHGADPTAATENKSTPLHWAAGRGHSKIVKLLAGVYGVDFAAPASDGSTPLHWAASRGKVAVMEVLLGIFCAQVDARDEKGCTPCLTATYNGHVAAVELLLNRFNAKVTTHDKKRTGLLHAACEMGHGQLASLLIEKYKMSTSEVDRRGLTPLARAAVRNQVDVFRLLVDKHGARLDTQTSRKSDLLHVACEAGAIDVAKLLLDEHGFDVNAKNAEGETPAFLAAARGHPNVLSLVVDGYGATLDTADAKGAGPLHKACERRDSSAASVLLESYGLQADQADPRGATPLHLAARGGDASLVELLAGPAGRANPSLRDAEGNQPLHIAAACGHLGVVRVLVEKASADPGARNRCDKSALDVAVANANTEVADYLRGVLPDKGQHHDKCRKRRKGFKRAGRWMRLARADGFLQDVALENVFLLPVPTLLALGRFPSHYDAIRKKHLVTAGDIPPQAQVLLVSHPLESPGNPDPSGRQFLALRRFLDEATADAERSKSEGGAGRGHDPEGFGFVWASFSCTSSNRMKPTFKTHMHNVLTAWSLADRALVIPETVTRFSDGLACTDLVGYVERGWCSVELLCLMHLDVPTTVYLAMGDAASHGTSNNCRPTSPERPTEKSLPSVFESLPSLDPATDPSQERSHEKSREPSPRESSVGACVSRAVECAAKRLFSLGALPTEVVREEPLDEAGLSGEPLDASSDPSDGIALRLWSLEAEAFLDGVANLVAEILKTLDDEVYRDRETLAGAPREGGAEDRDDEKDALVAKKAASSAELPEKSEGGKRREWESAAGKLLARVLNFGLVKQDMEDVGDGSHEGQEAAAASGLVKELSERLGGFSSVLDKLEATNTLLLVGCYFKGVRSSSGGSREPSGKFVSPGPDPGALASSTPSCSPSSRTGTGHVVPAVADSVPSCRVS